MSACKFGGGCKFATLGHWSTSGQVRFGGFQGRSFEHVWLQVSTTATLSSFWIARLWQCCLCGRTQRTLWVLGHKDVPTSCRRCWCVCGLCLVCELTWPDHKHLKPNTSSSRRSPFEQTDQVRGQLYTRNFQPKSTATASRTCDRPRTRSPYWHPCVWGGRSFAYSIWRASVSKFRCSG